MRNNLIQFSLSCVAFALFLLPSGNNITLAQDFAEGSQAKEWGLLGEEKALFTGNVVDLMCEITGDCPENCGNGLRQLGIVRESDNVLVPVLKNRQSSFNGAVDDLLPYCNKTVDVDGVLVADEDLSAVKFYMVQFIRNTGDQEWKKANRWTKAWAKRNPDSKGKGPWFRRDPRVKAQIEARGHFGLGAEADQEWLKENE